MRLLLDVFRGSKFLLNHEFMRSRKFANTHSPVAPAIFFVYFVSFVVKSFLPRMRRATRNPKPL